MASKREIKRLVCREGAQWLGNMLEAGGLHPPDEMSKEDVVRWESALQELIDELWRRGGE